MAFAISRQCLRKIGSPIPKSPNSFARNNNPTSQVKRFEDTGARNVPLKLTLSVSSPTASISAIKHLAVPKLFETSKAKEFVDQVQDEERSRPAVAIVKCVWDWEHILKEGLSGRHWNQLGKGGFGTVVRATYKGKDVAIKVVPVAYTKCMHNEVNALHLSHPNIVKVLRVLFKQEKYGLVIMELIRGSNLQKLLHDTSVKFTFSMRMRFACGLASAIEFCHSRGILHLDVKPLNILCSSNTCKLCDFGASRVLNNLKQYVLPCQGGTALYTDPEILENKQGSKMSDIFSLGITLWQLLSRQIPYKSYKIHKHTIIYQVVRNKLRPEELETHKQYDDYKSLYKMCWQQKSSERPSIEGVINRLMRIRAEFSE